MTDTFKELSRDAFLIEGFLDQASCEAQIARLEAIGFEAATFGGEGGERVNAVRNNDRIMEDDAALTTSLWERLVSALPEAWTTRQMMRRHALGAHRLIGLNARIRWYR